MKKVLNLAVCVVLMMGLCAPAAFSAEWRQKKEFRDDFGASVTIEATYYAAEFVEKNTLDEAQKNLWTEDEMEDYRYNLLQQLKLDDTIPIFLKIINRGPAIRMAPFESQIKLTVGKNRLMPVQFDRRFNFKITDEREGFVYFPRYNEKGDPYLTPKVKTVKLDIDGAISPVTLSRTISFFWDVKDDNPDKLFKGKSGARMEMDRLTKRLELLTKEGKGLQEKLDAIQAEIVKINSRMMELQRSM